MIRALLILAVLAAPTMAAAETTIFPRLSPGDGELLVYSSTDLATLSPAIDRFQALNREIEITYVDLDTAELYDRFVAEVDSGKPSADILLSSAMDLQVKLANDGYAAFHHSSAAESIPDWATWRDQAFGFTFEPAVIVYNRELVPPDHVPDTRFDLLRLMREHAETYRGRVVTYDIEESGVGYLLATQDAVVGGVFGSLLETFGRNDVVLKGNTSEMLEGIADGRYLLGYNVLGSYAQVWAERNSAIGIVLPSDYTLAISRTAIISAEARNPDEAHRFLDYLLSIEGQRVLTDSGRLSAVRPEVTGPYSRIGISENRVGPLRSIQLGPGLLVYLDRLKREKFLTSWREGIRRD
ncbi:ABC transporter substrate-binding protein [Inquilinus sp. CAU 1745]|uniref:ABC transporter substrate-binding protein n=1 Tax=Inquilinus sp. CAU 1745 TaxID=3140369 RepID=UPI00325B8AEB